MMLSLKRSLLKKNLTDLSVPILLKKTKYCFLGIQHCILRSKFPD